MNRRSAVIDANGNTTKYEYDALGRQTKIITPLGNTTLTQYDASNNVSHITDANAVAGSQPKNNQNATVYTQYDELNRPTLTRNALNGDTQTTYDLLGNITSITDALGQTTTFIYDDLGRLTETRDPVIEAGTDKTNKVLQYDKAGNALLTEDRTGRQRRYTYDKLNRNILTEYLSDSTQDSYTYDAFGDLTQLSNNDVIYRYRYTPRHKPQSKIDSRLNKTLSWTYGNVGNLNTKTDYQNDVTTYQYRILGTQYLIIIMLYICDARFVNEATQAVTPPPGEFDSLQLNTPVAGQTTLEFRNGTKYVFAGPVTLQTTPGQTARLSYIEDAYNNRLTMTYDTNNRLSTITDNLGINGRTGLTLNYTGTNPHIQSITDWTGRRWSYGYTGGNLSAITNPLNDTVSYTYHAGTNLLNEMILPENRSGQAAKTAFTYYRNNKAFTNANALGEGETVDYDLYRQRTRITDPRGFIRTHFYDKANGALLKLDEPDGAILRFANTTDAMRYSKTDGLGYTTQYSYQTSRAISAAATDNFGRVSREVDALNQNIDTDYGLYDQATLTVNKRGIPVTRSYYASTNIATDAVAGKLKELRTTVNGAPNTLLASYTYYATGAAFGQLKQRIETIDPAAPTRQRITHYVYESNGLNLQSQTVTGATTGDSITTNYTYDALGRILSQSLNRLTSATDSTPLTLTTSFAYDALGRVIKTTNPRGDISETLFDKNGKVSQTKVHYFTNTPRANCAAPSGGYVVCTTATHTYDAADRRVSTTDILANITTFAYDANGNLIATTDANGHTAKIEYDSMNRRSAVIDANGYRSEMTYDLGGHLIASTDANGNVTKYEYDALGRQTKITTPLGNTTLTQYDASNNASHITDANAVTGSQPKNNQNATVYTQYDELNRAKAAGNPCTDASSEA